MREGPKHTHLAARTRVLSLIFSPTYTFPANVPREPAYFPIKLFFLFFCLGTSAKY